MKAKPNELFEDFTGSTGNITAAHSAGHLVVRNKVAPTYTDTEYQRVVRQNFTRFAKNWQDLTDVQRTLGQKKQKSFLPPVPTTAYPVKSAASTFTSVAT